jgi:hypothetical protein
MRGLVMLVLTLICLPALARDASEAERTMMDRLYLSLATHVEGGRFEGTYRVTEFRDSLTPEERAKGMEWLRVIGRRNYDKILGAEDMAYFRRYGILEISGHVDDPVVRERLQKRNEEYWSTHADQWLILKKPFTCTYTFTAELARDNQQARLEKTLEGTENAPVYFDRKEEASVTGVAHGSGCLVYQPVARKALKLKVVEATGVAYLVGLPEITSVGLPAVQGLDAEDIRVLGESTDHGEKAVDVLLDAGTKVLWMRVLPEKDYRVARCRTYRAGRLERDETYGRWQKLPNGAWYPLDQMCDLVQRVELRQDLEGQLRQGTLSLTSMALLQGQEPKRWMRHQRTLTKVSAAAVSPERMQLQIPPGIKTEEFSASIGPDF